MGRPSKLKIDFIAQAEKLCKLGATDIEIADFFERQPTEEEYLCRWLALHRENRTERVIAPRKRNRSPSARIVNAMRARMWAALKGRTDGALFSRLPYSREDLMTHLQAKFAPGMDWGNYGAWHVDHVKPCAVFDQSAHDQFSECWALANLQPLWASDNTRKGCSYGAP